MPTTPNQAAYDRKQRDRERAAKYYREHRAAVCARTRSRYANDPEHREAVKRRARERYAAFKRGVVESEAYRKGYAAGVRAEAERAARSFANFRQPSTPAQAARLTDPTGAH